MVSSVRSVKTSEVAGGLIVSSVSVAFPIRCISRWPAVMLAVKRTARATGWMIRLMVSIVTSMGMSNVGVPCGRR